MPSNTDNITVTTSNQNPFNPQNSSVAAGGTVNFLGRSGTVTTFVNGSSRQVFSQGSPPYSVPYSGYTLLSSISGLVTIQYNAPSDNERSGGPQTGANGTINVGGGGDPEPK
jgi:hypothetical protein